MLEGKKIILGISGSIAAYKSAYLVRALKKMKAEVKVVMTDSASEFIGPLTLSTLSENPVYSQFSDKKTGAWTNHVELGLWADLMVVAPASASTLSKMANGHCDNLLIATYLSAKCPVWFAPAMDLDMYKHPTTKENIQKLESFGNICIEPTNGELASGLIGKGRMEEPEVIAQLIEKYFNNQHEFSGKKIIVTAGPTFEAIDPVRFIGNHSSGKMGVAIADEFAERGAEVTLICGPSSIQSNNNKVKRIDVTSAEEMYQAVFASQDTLDVAVMAAAVADYTPVSISSEKVKKKEGDLKVDLKRTKDILKSLGGVKKEGQVLVGFAMETQNELENASKKVKSKNADFIVLNSLREEGAGFKGDTNKVTFVYPNNKTTHFELKSKLDVAKDIADSVKDLLYV
ncbi:MAG: bifunctional phosphopantothenoylcysteine decarboxylase/phosphopantothenate--cysteine ligase CoaBC [Flavobacteriales bacterium]|mgnify:CR=1 FL=1|nr:bifunctional phosphopantothenoylcysteine decarboxylase/phosphopantothenate--cysteine ligase CoaBC [Flavobacteriales bacterium]|tara:strand:- start:7067 stop:8269 length:1203 start_codon:yes stop_codon:yes gene_type:complete